MYLDSDGSIRCSHGALIHLAPIIVEQGDYLLGVPPNMCDYVYYSNFLSAAVYQGKLPKDEEFVKSLEDKVENVYFKLTDRKGGEDWEYIPDQSLPQLGRQWTLEDYGREDVKIVMEFRHRMNVENYSRGCILHKRYLKT